MKRTWLWLACVLVFLAAPAFAQAPALKSVAFQASPDHNLTLTGGLVVVARYELVLVKSGSTAAVATLDLGKPTPDANGLISLVNVPLPAALPSADYVGRLAAVGPGGRSADLVSPPFPKAGPPAVPTGSLSIVPQ
jgi:hypothetical protein